MRADSTSPALAVALSLALVGAVSCSSVAENSTSTATAGGAAGTGGGAVACAAGGAGGTGGMGGFAVPACDGTVQRSANVRLTPRGAYASVQVPPVWTGDRFGVVWLDLRDGSGGWDAARVYLQLADALGQRRGDNVPVSDVGAIGSPALAFGAGRFGVAWNDMGNIRFASVDVDGAQATAPITVGISDVQNATTRVAWAVDRFVLVWGASDAAGMTVMLATVSAEGAPMDAPTQVLATTGAPW